MVHSTRKDVPALNAYTRPCCLLISHPDISGSIERQAHGNRLIKNATVLLKTVITKETMMGCRGESTTRIVSERNKNGRTALSRRFLAQKQMKNKRREVELIDPSVRVHQRVFYAHAVSSLIVSQVTTSSRSSRRQPKRRRKLNFSPRRNLRRTTTRKP